MNWNYELLDFGCGRKLERFGDFLLDRPSPAAESFEKSLPTSQWSRADARFIRQKGLRGIWQFQRAFPETWLWKNPLFTMELKPTEVGHLGLFPEQAENWEWLYQKTLQNLATGKPFRVLNLFGYTGGSSLAVAAAMREVGITAQHRDSWAVTHLDAAQNVVQWAKRNATLSHLQDVPIRWIAEDALKFVLREQKRGKRYEALILDPPSYGHGKKGEVWRLERDLPRLLDVCAALLDNSPRFVLLTVHSPGYTPLRLGKILHHHFPNATEIQTFPIFLKTSRHKKLPAGAASFFGGME